MRGNKGISTATLAAESFCWLVILWWRTLKRPRDSAVPLPQPFWQSLLSGLPVSASQLQHGPQCSWEEEKPHLSCSRVQCISALNGGQSWQGDKQSTGCVGWQPRLVKGKLLLSSQKAGQVCPMLQRVTDLSLADGWMITVQQLLLARQVYKNYSPF